MTEPLPSEAPPPLPPRWQRGLRSILAFLVFPWPQIIRRRAQPFLSEDRLAHGWVIVLPGVDGRSHFNEQLVQGLNDAGLRSAIELVDWTTGCVLAAPYHLRSRRLHDRQAAELAARIVAYQQDYPGRPVQIVAHSGGSQIALMAASRLDEAAPVDSITLLAPAVSRGFDLSAALARVYCGIEAYSSWLDAFHLGLITTLLGTTDGRHEPAAGVSGFATPSDDALARDLKQHRLRWNWLRHFHCGGHLGYCNRVFAAEIVAMKLREVESRRLGFDRNPGDPHTGTVETAAVP